MRLPKPYRLERWSIPAPSRYTAPEIAELRIVGCVYGRRGMLDGDRGRELQDGDEIVTSPVVSVRGRVVTTASGSRYRLGSPSTSYLLWLKEQKIAFNPDRPIRIKRPKKAA